MEMAQQKCSDQLTGHKVKGRETQILAYSPSCGGGHVTDPIQRREERGTELNMASLPPGSAGSFSHSAHIH